MNKNNSPIFQVNKDGKQNSGEDNTLAITKTFIEKESQLEGKQTDEIKLDIEHTDSTLGLKVINENQYVGKVENETTATYQPPQQPGYYPAPPYPSSAYTPYPPYQQAPPPPGPPPQGWYPPGYYAQPPPSSPDPGGGPPPQFGWNQRLQGGQAQVFVYDPKTRNSFVKKVLGLVLLMLLVTSGFLAGVYTMKPMNDFFMTVYGWILLGCGFILLMGVQYAFMCSRCATEAPCSYFCLTLTVVAMSLITAKITGHYKTEIIFYAVIATTAVVLVCFLLAFSKFDFTSYMLYIVAIVTAISAIVAIVLLVLMLTNTRSKPAMLALLVVVTLGQVIMLVLELQMVLGGKTVQLEESEYALGAFLLYVSVVQLFTQMVQILDLASS